MLSAQLAATVLSVTAGGVKANEYVYVGTDNPGSNPLMNAGNVNGQGTNLTGNLIPLDDGSHLIEIQDLIDAAKAQLNAYGTVTSSVNSSQRAYSEALKIVFDSINKNKILIYDL